VIGDATIQEKPQAAELGKLLTGEIIIAFMSEVLLSVCI